MKITILSDGGWATALSQLLIRNGHKVTMWGPFPEYLDEMRETRLNRKFLTGVLLDDRLLFESDMQKAVHDAELIVLAMPTQYLRSVLAKFKPFFKQNQHLLVNVAKGIEIDSWMRISEVTKDVLGSCRYVGLSGPSHAEEVSRQIPTLVVAASQNQKDAETVQSAFMNSKFRVYTSDDLCGIEYGGSLKNVLAIAAGIIDGMSLGDNPKAALITRGIAEMSRLGEKLGGKAETFMGLSGIGDLIVTCTSGHSRNRHVGEALGHGLSLADIKKEMGMVVAEGVYTAKGAKHLADTNDIEAPIIQEIYAVLYEGKTPLAAIHDLMCRDAKPEIINDGI